jgi:DNA-binding transcriptional ArsR family regulator
VGADGAGARGPHDLRGRGALKPSRHTKAAAGASALTPVEKLEALDRVVDAIAHPARRQILLTLHFRGGKATAGELAARFEHAWPTTTRHLRVLEDAGLLVHERLGRTRLYTLDRERLALVSEWLGWFAT